MKSPFPGMDPYLEARDLWRGLHLRLINHISDCLQPLLPPRYVATVDERVELGATDEEGAYIPDVAVIERNERTRSGGAALATAPVELSEPEIVAVPGLRQPHRFVEIRRAQENDLVSVIEVLSPWNKTGLGREKYRTKQQEYLLNEISLIEIDLLRRGQHTIAVPQAHLGPADYRVCVLPGGSDHFRLYRLSLRQRLPVIGVPLAGEDPDVPLDLQTVFERVYELGAYARRIDYSGEPDPRLNPEDAAWARERIEAWRAEAATSGQ